jgi:DNA-binding response OmpR family regulator
MTPKKIIVVDDDENIRKTFYLLLGKKYRVYPARDAREALAMSRSAKADLVIADYMLPRLNGMDLIRKLRETGFTGEAMLISGHPEMVKTDDLSRWAISCFFVKPLDLKELDLSIERVLQPKKFPALGA